MIIYLLIVLGALFRILSNATGFEVFPPNFAPIGAISFFGGFYLPKKQGLIIPIVALLISDLVIGFYEPLVMASVYLSFVAINLMGQFLKCRGFLATLAGIVASSLFFYFVTNTAVWINPRSSYSNDLKGLISSLVAGLPFLKFTLMGDLFFNGVFFGLFIFARGSIKSNKFKFLLDPALKISL